MDTETILMKINDTLDNINKNIIAINDKIDIFIEKLESKSNNQQSKKVERWIGSLKEKSQ